MNALHAVRVDVANLWTSPDAPDDLDGLSLGPRPDQAGWLAAVDATERGRAFDDRLETQLLVGEPVEVHEVRPDGWARVTCPWQPSRKHDRGYPGWIAPGQLGRELDRLPVPPATDDRSLLDICRDFLGLSYLWGGMSRYGIDCSGLVHFAARARGFVLHRDADDQRVDTTPVELGGERAGDLYFFARPGKEIHHVGVVVEPGRMVHAPLTDVDVVEESLDQERTATLVAAGRLPAEVRG